jgi:hypothetical protein
MLNDILCLGTIFCHTEYFNDSDQCEVPGGIASFRK